MTHERDIDRLLDQWFLDGPSEVADRVIVDAAARIDRQPQRPAWRFLRRPTPMTSSVRWAAVLVAVALIAAVGFVVLGRRPSDSDISASPSPTAESSPTSSSATTIPDTLKALWIGETRLLPEVLGTQDRSFLDLQPAVAVYRFGGGAALGSTVAPAGPDRITFTSTDGAVGCEKGEVGTYAWSLSPGGTTLTLVAEGADACAARLAALPGSWTRSSCLDSTKTCLGAVEAGTYRSTFFDPFGQPSGPTGDSTMPYGQVSYTVPDGWANMSDSQTIFNLVPQADYEAQYLGTGRFHGIFLFADPAVSSQDAACSPKDEPGVGRSAVEMAARIAQIPGLVVSDPTPITIDGRSGTMLDVSIPSTRTQTCPGSNGMVMASVIHQAGGQGWMWWLGAPERWRLILLDLADSKGLAIVVDDSSEPSRFDELVARAMPIVESFQFHPPTP